MKQLFIMRHAKSSWNNTNLKDFDRPLNERGQKAAEFMGQFLKNTNNSPELILCSTAKRTRETSEILLNQFDNQPEIKYLNEFYQSQAEIILEEIKRCSESVEKLMVIGHNPELQHLVATLCSDESLFFRFPSAAIACIEPIENKWADVIPGTNLLKWLIQPKLLQTWAQ